MNIGNGVSSSLEKYLDLADRQLQLTAKNMANIDVPGFKTRGFDFDRAMRQAMQEDSGQSEGGERQGLVQTELVDGLISRPDGNNVSVDREGMKMSDAQLKFRTGVALLRQQYSQISEAIHSDSK